MKQYKDIDEYISNFPDDVQDILEKIRQTIHAAAPEAVEKISYGIPTFKQKGNVVHFAAYASHIGFYPGAQALEVFAKEVQSYRTGKGTLQFSLDKPIPYKLIADITKYRVKADK